MQTGSWKWVYGDGPAYEGLCFSMDAPQEPQLLLIVLKGPIVGVVLFSVAAAQVLVLAERPKHKFQSLFTDFVSERCISAASYAAR